MIDEKKLIDHIKSIEMSYQKAWEQFDSEYDFGGMNACGAIIAYIEDMPKIGEWIPCNKGLPKDDYTTVLVWLDSKIYDIAIWHHEYEFRPWYAEYFNDAPQEWKGSVIAWQPLPEPLRKEEIK